MNNVLNDLKGYQLRKTRNYNLEKGNVTRDLRASEGPNDLVREFSELVEKLNVIGILPGMQGPMRSIKAIANSLRIVDEEARLSYANDNLRRINNMDKILQQETIRFGENGVQALEAKFCMKYENMKRQLKENKEALTVQSRMINSLETTLSRMNRDLKELERNKVGNASKIENLKEEIHKKELELCDAKMIKLKLGLRRASLKNLSEKNIVDMAKDINKTNRSDTALRVIGGLAHIAADIILTFAMPVSKVIVTALQLPIVIGKLIKAMDMHIFKKLREKSEASRKEEMMKVQIKNLNKELGNDKFNEIVADEKDVAKQLEKIEQTNDKEIKYAFEASRRTQNVLYAKPKWSLRMFKIKAREDNDRLEDVAKFVLKHIKELPNEDRAREELEKEHLSFETRFKIMKGLEQATECRERIKAMLEVLGIDNADDFIKEVKEYKSKKEEDLKAVENHKDRLSNADKEHFADKKNKLKERIVEAMKQKL